MGVTLLKFFIATDIHKAKALPIGTVTGKWKKISEKKWKYIGSGHQGHVYKVDEDTIVKVSKQTPFNKFNPQKTPAQARGDILSEHEVMEALKLHPIVPEKIGTWRKGGKMFLVRENLEPVEK